MAEFKDIKFKDQITEYSTLKAGLKRSDLNGNIKLQSIFDAIDKANKNGIKDGVLDENEIENFMQKVVEFAKGGRDKNLSSKEANKLLQALGLTNLDETNLFNLLNTLSNQSKNIKQTTKNTQNNSIIIEYTDGHTEEIFQDGSKIITIKNGNKTDVTKEDKDGKVISKTETTLENGVEIVVEYESETPKSKTVTNTNNNTISSYAFKDGEETLIKEENTQTGDVTTYQDEIKTITKQDGTVIVEQDGRTTTTSPDGNTITANSENGTVTTVKNPEENSETITITDNDGTTTVLNKKDGKNISQTVTKNGQTYSVEYDGNGNTKGVVVQNGESPAAIAKKFGCKLEDLIAANHDVIKGKAPNQYFLVGSEIVIPGEMDAEKFTKINAGRQTKDQAIGKYTQFVQAQQAQIKAEDEELAERKNYRRIFIEQKWNTFEECAIAYYKREGVTKPTKRQIELRVKELQKLNPNLKDGKIKGKKIIATFSPETDAQIGAGQQKRESARMEKKQKVETAAGKNLAKTMHDAIDGLSWGGGLSKREFTNALNKVNSNNVIGILKQYNELSPDETLIEAIFDETGSSLEDRKNAVQKIINSLIQRAEKANVSDERQKQAIEACKQELKSYWSMGIGYCQTSKLDGLINNLIGTIDAAEALTNEEKNRMGGNGIDDTINLMNTQVSENTSALNAQLAEDGWCADLYEGLKWCVGSDNLDENVKADLKEYQGYIAELQKAEQTGGEAGFKAKFKEIFGVDYNPNWVKGYNKLQSNFAMAQGLTIQKEGFYAEFGSCINGQADYSSMRTKYGQYLQQLAQAEGQNIDANNAVDKIIANQLQKQGLDINTATDTQKRQALKTVITNTYNAINAELNKYTQGRSLANMEKQLKNAGSAVFGNKNDIAFRVNDYISSQKQGGAAVNMGVKAVGAIAIGIATGGAGFAALATASLATAVVSASVDLTDRASSDVGLKEGEVKNILKNATIDGVSVFAGGVVGKYAAMFKNANSFVQAGGKLSMMVTGDVATGAATEYLQTGTITLEGVTFQAIFSAAGNLVSLKQLAKVDTPTPKQQTNPQEVVLGRISNNKTASSVGKLSDVNFQSLKEEIQNKLKNITNEADLNALSKQLDVIQNREQRRALQKLIEQKRASLKSKPTHKQEPAPTPDPVPASEPTPNNSTARKVKQAQELKQVYSDLENKINSLTSLTKEDYTKLKTLITTQMAEAKDDMNVLLQKLDNKMEELKQMVVPEVPSKPVVTNPSTLSEYYPTPSAEPVKFKASIFKTKEVKTASDVRQYLTSFDHKVSNTHIEEMVKLFEANPKRFNRIANSGLFDLINSGYMDKTTYERLFAIVTINENTFLSNRVLGEISLVKAQLKQGIKPSLVKTIPNNAPADYISKNIRVGEVFERDNLLWVRNGENDFTQINMKKDTFDKIFPPIKSSSFNQGSIGDCWLVSAIDNMMDYPQGRATIFSMFEQVGDDIIVKIPGAKTPVKFPNGVVLDAAGRQIRGASGIQMIEQAYMNHALAINRTGFSPEELANLTDISKQMDILEYGKAIEGWETLLNKPGKSIFDVASAEDIIRTNALGTDKMIGISLNKGTPIPGKRETLIDESKHLFAHHAYALKSFDPTTNMCYLTNPWNAAMIIEIPLDDILKHFKRLDIISFQ